MVVNKKLKKLVLDTSAFLKHIPVWELGEEFYSVSDVIQEIRDKETRNYIDSFPVQLQLREPSPTSVKFINDFTKKTGDFAVLSLADIKILALTYELEVEAKGTASHLRAEPLPQRTQQIASVKPPPHTDLEGNPIVTEGFYVSSEKKRDSSVDASQISSLSSQTSDEEEANFALRIEHLPHVNDHLSLFPYIGGYVLTDDDLLFLNHLLRQFPLLKKLSELASRHRLGGQWFLFRQLCQQCASFPLSPGGETPNNKNPTEEECESMKIARQFCREYSAQWPHLVRWFMHLLTFDEEDLEDPSNSFLKTNAEVTASAKPSIEKIFNRLFHRDNAVLENQRGSPNITTDDLRNLNLNPENDRVKEHIESATITESSAHSSRPQTNEGECSSGVESDDREFENEDGGYEDTDGSQDDCEEDDDDDFEDESDDDDEGWITPSTIKAIKKDSFEDTLPDKVEVACITGDFAMQNTLKHIGLHIIGVDGKLLQTVRTFILRCYACFKTTNRMEKIFCPNCGHKTLKRVSVTLNPDGTQRIWISTKKSINLRGTKFPIPRPKGGKHGRNPILVADQREAQQRVSKLSRMKNDPMHEDYDTRSGISPFLTRDVYSRSAQLGIRTGKKQHQGIYYWEQKNPNEPLKKGTRKKKR